MKNKFICETKDVRLDVFLTENTSFSRSFIKTMNDESRILINGKQEKAGYKLRVGDVVEVDVKEVEKIDVSPENIPLDIIYQDADVAVINKPQGMTVHAGNGTSGSTLVNALLYHLDNLSGINGVIRPGIVHRIDKNTSGLLVVAKNDKAHNSLAQQIEKKECKRIYVALLEGVLKSDEGRIETFIGRDTKDRTKMAVTKFGKTAITDYKVIKRYQNNTLCEFSLQTGRTHQIRVHAKHLGHPVVGDPEYGYKNQKFNLDGQLLHAKELVLTHPKTGELMHFEADLPEYFEKVLEKLRNQQK